MGIGPHLCFLHGFCEDSTLWKSSLQHLQKTYTCLTIDLPGFGKSTSASFTSITDISRQIHEIILHEKIGKHLLLGHSLGGYVAVDYAAHYPEYLSGLGLIHSTAAEDAAEKKANRKKTIHFIQRHGTVEFFQLFIKTLVAEHHSDCLTPALIHTIQNTPTTSIIQGLQAMLHRKDHRDTLASLSIPILFLMGEYDIHYDMHDIFEQASRCDIAQIQMIDHVGHLSMVENEKAYLSVLQQFLDFTHTLH